MTTATTGKNAHPELIEKLAEGISNLTSSEEWRRYLDFQSRFHRYSYNNVLLIAIQSPGATQVAGFNAWKKMGRFVRKGEKAVWIVAPMIYKQTDERTDEATGDETQTPRKVIRGFKWVPVFDVSQTEGDELPSVCHRLDGDDPAGHYATLVGVARSIGFTVEDAELPGSVNGDCSHVERRIRVEVTNPPAQRVKTLAHEIGHALLHEKYDNRALAELEAESTAYVVCQALGLDTSDYSFGYVASWAGGGDQAIAAIKASCERIQRTATVILRAFEVAVEVAA
jgi:antirestriction protein ArdC